MSNKALFFSCVQSLFWLEGVGWRMHYWRISTPQGSLIEFANILKKHDSEYISEESHLVCELAYLTTPRIRRILFLAIPTPIL